MVEERYPDLNEMEDLRFDEIWEDHWRYITEGNDDKKEYSCPEAECIR